MLLVGLVCVKPAIGDFVGRFKITGEIGSGGMGYVFSAVDSELKRVVAVKILQLSSSNSADQIERFKREGRVLSLLQHPNIVRVYATGIWQQHYPYLVMELLHGESLAALIARNGSLPEREALSLLMDICAALKLVHSHNVIHRDLKPQNIFLARQDNAVAVKLLDFGLCRIDTAAEHLTATGLLLGSPHYLSPEVCTGARSCPQSDIYALGVILYEMLSGSPPFTSDNYVGVIYKHANKMAEPLSVICPQLNLVAEIDRIISKCLEKKPADRYETAEDLSNDIAGLLEQLACQDSRASSPGAARGEKNFTHSAFLAVALFLLAIIFVTTQMERISPPALKSEPNLSARAKSSGPRTVSQLKESLQNLERFADIKNPGTIRKARDLIDSWAIRRESTISESEAAQGALLKGAWLLKSANRSEASQGEELLMNLLTRAERGHDALTELEIRSLLTGYYHKTEQGDKLRSVSQRIYQVWYRHRSEKSFFWAARGLRTRALAGPWVVPNLAEEEKERLKGLAFDKNALDTFEKGSIVVTGFYREDLCEIVQFYLQHDNVEAADRFLMQLESTLQTQEFPDTKEFQPRVSLLKARLALAKGSASQALAALSLSPVSPDPNEQVEHHLVSYCALRKLARHKEALEQLALVKDKFEKSSELKTRWSDRYESALTRDSP